MTDAPLIPSALYGLRTWRLGSDGGGELLVAAAHRRIPWPGGGAWLEARCSRSHAHPAPHPDCTCGIHAWHPTRASARRVLAGRFEVPGIVEAAGAVQVHEDGFRAERGHPFALVLTPGRNAGLVARLAERYGAQIVDVPGAEALLSWCRERGLGLEPAVVRDLLGTDAAPPRRRLLRTATRRDVVRASAGVGLVTAMLGFGIFFASAPPGDEGVFGRSGWVKPPASRARPSPATAPAARPAAPPAARPAAARRPTHHRAPPPR